jgi:DNA-binding CsgD family transcriptional regulator
MTAGHNLKNTSQTLPPNQELGLEPVGVRASNPLGDVVEQSSALSGFCAYDLIASAQESVPAWQRERGEKLQEVQAAALERRTILNALAQFNRFGVIITETGGVIQGSAGWTQQVAATPTLSFSRGMLAPASRASHIEFLAALQLLFSNYNLQSVPVALRDLDGWVTDILHIKRVGPSNPHRACVLLPKSSIEVANTLTTLSVALKLTPLETTLVRLLMKGATDREIAAGANLKLCDVKAGMRQLVAKFRVRQKCDIARLVAGFP